MREITITRKQYERIKQIFEMYDTQGVLINEYDINEDQRRKILEELIELV